jgi:nonsense-mediated mRNA decay protein 3
MKNARDLEENPDMRFNIPLYHERDYQPSEIASMATYGEDAFYSTRRVAC